MKSFFLKGGPARNLLFAAMLAALGISGAFALNVDQTRTMSQRSYQDYHPTYYRVTINFNDPNISSGQAFGAMAKNTYINTIDCHVTTAFNASTTNVVTFGTTKTSANEIVASSGANGSLTGNPLAAGVNHLTAAIGLGVNATSAADVTLWAKYAQTGTAATTGVVTCVIEFINPGDFL